jgi:mRNA interferase HicA
VKRKDLIKIIGSTAKKQGLRFELVREGGQHTLYSLNGQNVVIPRHREINEITAKAIMKDLEGQVGKDWWL